MTPILASPRPRPCSLSPTRQRNSACGFLPGSRTQWAAQDDNPTAWRPAPSSPVFILYNIFAKLACVVIMKLNLAAAFGVLLLLAACEPQVSIPQGVQVY